MERTKHRNLRYYLRWALWVIVIQTVLANISASIYAYKFTHFYSQPAPVYAGQNMLDKTWKLFVGPSFYKDTSEPAPSFPFEHIQFNTSDHLSIDGWYSTVDSAKGCVILFHGLMANKSFVEDEASMFRRWGYNVLLADFRAHGKSGGNTTTFGVKETDEVQQACRFARARGNSKVILYGISLGAGVCIKAVADGKAAPSAIIADMPFGTLHHHLKARARALGFPAEPFGALVTMWIGIEKGYNGFRHNIAHCAPQVHCPVLVQWGDQDQYVSRDEIDQIYNGLGSVNKRLVVYGNANHEGLLRFDPLLWGKEVKGFLEKVK